MVFSLDDYKRMQAKVDALGKRKTGEPPESSYRKEATLASPKINSTDVPIIIRVKPLSVNDCWKGRRFKTKDYREYEKTILGLLPDVLIPSPPYFIQIEFGFSSSGGDIDNPIKPILDILQKKYGFNDNKIVRIEVIRRIVKKGEEFFSFKIMSYI